MIESAHFVHFAQSLLASTNAQEILSEMYPDGKTSSYF